MLRKKISIALFSSPKGFFLFPHKSFRFWSEIPQAFWTNLHNTQVVTLPIHIQIQDTVGACGLPQVFLDFLSICTDKTRRKNNIFTTHLASSFMNCNILIITGTHQEQLQSGTVRNWSFCNIKPSSFIWVRCRTNAIHMRKHQSFSFGEKGAASACLLTLRDILVCNFIWVLLSKKWWYFILPHADSGHWCCWPMRRDLKGIWPLCWYLRFVFLKKARWQTLHVFQNYLGNSNTLKHIVKAVKGSY